MDIVCGADLADMKLISKFNKIFKFLLCVIEICSKYACVISLKDKQGITITNAFHKVLDKSNCKPKKIWADKDNEFYNRSMKSVCRIMIQKCKQDIMEEILLQDFLSEKNL